MTVLNYNHGKFFGPSASYAGLILIAAGILTMSYSLTALVLVVPGAFLAFTSTGTLIDTANKRIRPYTSFFVIIRTGKWINIDQFTRFSISKATRKYTSYSRANVRFDMDVSAIRLLLLNHDGTRKVVINNYEKFEDAQKEMDKLSLILFPEKET